MRTPWLAVALVASSSPRPALAQGSPGEFPSFNLYLLAAVLTILALGVLASWLHRPGAHHGASEA